MIWNDGKKHIITKGNSGFDSVMVPGHADYLKNIKRESDKSERNLRLIFLTDICNLFTFSFV